MSEYRETAFDSIEIKPEIIESISKFHHSIQKSTYNAHFNNT